MLKKAKGLVTKGCRMTSIDKNDARCPHELCMKVKQKCKMTNEWRETDRQPQVGVFLLPRSVARPACPQPGTQTKKRNEEIYYSTHTVHTLQIPIRFKKRQIHNLQISTKSSIYTEKVVFCIYYFYIYSEGNNYLGSCWFYKFEHLQKTNSVILMVVSV